MFGKIGKIFEQKPQNKIEHETNPEAVRDEINYLKGRRKHAIKRLRMLVLSGVIVSQFAMNACNQAEKGEADPAKTEELTPPISTEDSLRKIILERENTNGAQSILYDTRRQISMIDDELAKSEPGDSVGKIPVYYSGEYRSVRGIPGRLGHETKAGVTSFDLIHYSGGDFNVECWTRQSSGEDVRIDKTFDKSGVIINQRWTTNDVLNGKKVYKVYNQYYNRVKGKFQESLAVYERKPTGGLGEIIQNESYERENLDKRPTLHPEEFTALGGSPEHFYKSAIEAYNNAKTPVGEASK